MDNGRFEDLMSGDARLLQLLWLGDHQDNHLSQLSEIQLQKWAVGAGSFSSPFSCLSYPSQMQLLCRYAQCLFGA